MNVKQRWPADSNTANNITYSSIWVTKMNYVKQSIHIYTQTQTHTHTHTHIKSDSKTNRLKFLFPQNGYNIRIKAFHILNAPPFCDVLVSLLKRVFKSKLAARVSNFNRKHFPFVLSFIISICIRYFQWKCNDFFFFFFFFFCPKLTKSTDTYSYIDDSIVLVVKSCWLEIAYWCFKKCVYILTYIYMYIYIYLRL